MSDERLVKIVAAVGFAAAVALGLYLRFGYTVDERLLPALPPRPAPTGERALKEADFTPAMYEAYLAKDCDEVYHVPRVTLDEMSSPFPYERVEPQRTLAPGDPPIETQTLKLSVRVQRMQASEGGGTYATDHLILTIENKVASHLAYRVATSPDESAQRCMGKADLPHDAIALAPHEKVERTECVYRKGMALRVDAVETVILPELSYYYVSRLVPTHIGLDVRATRGHAPPLGEPCSTIPEQAIRVGLEKRTASWHDVIDFYARHRCDTYLFSVGYHALSRKGELPLPWSGAEH